MKYLAIATLAIALLSLFHRVFTYLIWLVGFGSWFHNSILWKIGEPIVILSDKLPPVMLASLLVWYFFSKKSEA